jgi:hypothetical protein
VPRGEARDRGFRSPRPGGNGSQLAAEVRLRAEYPVVHGELGLDHVLVDADGSPVLIDRKAAGVSVDADDARDEHMRSGYCYPVVHNAEMGRQPSPSPKLSESAPQ